MAEERQTAIERDRKRQTQQTDALLERVHNILNNIHYEPDRAFLSPMLRPKTSPGSVLVQKQNLSTSSSSSSSSTSLKKETLRLLNQRMEREKISPDGSVFSALSASPTGSYARLPSPQSSLSPLTHRSLRSSRHPAASNILISCPITESELTSDLMKACSCSEFSDGQLSVISSTSRVQVQSSLSGSPQHEKTKPVRRSPPAPLNRSYDVESPSPSLIRPHVFTPSPASASDGTVTCTLQQEEGFTQRQQEEPKKHNCSYETDDQEIETLSEENTNLEREDGRISVEHMKGFCHLNALARGFLTRRLLQTDKIKHLRKTVQDSREFLRSFQSDSQLKRLSISHQDLSLVHRVTAQQRAALHDIHQIFFMWPVKDKLNLLKQDREIHTERTIRDMEKVRGPGARRISSATLKTLERKKTRQANIIKVMPKSSSASRVVRSRLTEPSAVRQRGECVEVRRVSVPRTCLSMR